ncbi:hypothetical protein E3N88_06744 [Mikania micrantha]|uniref:Uncharacterized protein n=1 Tax=Mikania micrantha TaxID=192012 RepID=A0A5N6PPL3_9ASTR|nr:hypothetical protein E3N88_06744 [Mikania micrantha]
MCLSPSITVEFTKYVLEDLITFWKAKAGKGGQVIGCVVPCLSWRRQVKWWKIGDRDLKAELKFTNSVRSRTLLSLLMPSSTFDTRMETQKLEDGKPKGGATKAPRFL